MKKNNVTVTEAVHCQNDSVSWSHGISLAEYYQHASAWRRSPGCTQDSLGPCQFMNILITMDPIVNGPSDYSKHLFRQNTVSCNLPNNNNNNPPPQNLRTVTTLLPEIYFTMNDSWCFLLFLIVETIFMLAQ